MMGGRDGLWATSVADTPSAAISFHAGGLTLTNEYGPAVRAKLSSGIPAASSALCSASLCSHDERPDAAPIL
ncbi:hypothetical protein GCM10010383_02820 [Streptomyces lomondensis]|uniref:Uncharacterized protein n=1 Tax=Streptomyces lomondensis TaxID=68229 RepID=A0ABQ2WWJ9_9ACTN|nr:hypothetical protein GCM10010383_02820 [Streptomyces lomondensis]